MIRQLLSRLIIEKAIIKHNREQAVVVLKPIGNMINGESVHYFINNSTNIP